MRPTPYVVESIERNGETVFRHGPSLATIKSVDRAAFYQLKTMLQGVLARGTARSIASLSPYAAGKIAAKEHPPNASGWMQKARSVIPNMCWYRAKALMPNGRATIEKPAPLAIRVSARAPFTMVILARAWGLRWENGQGWHQQQQQQTPQW